MAPLPPTTYLPTPNSSTTNYGLPFVTCSGDACTPGHSEPGAETRIEHEVTRSRGGTCSRDRDSADGGIVQHSAQPYRTVVATESL